MKNTSTAIHAREVDTGNSIPHETFFYFQFDIYMIYDVNNLQFFIPFILCIRSLTCYLL